ncbi:MAG: DUF4258 domain-containing protein [Nitrospirae bacterium]|nr:DUF4258 domain-containing protein [Nitrospirota bacterium]
MIVKCKSILFSAHAVRRMFLRGIGKDDIRSVIVSGEIIIEYPSDTPYPSCLMLGFIRDIPIHVVLGINSDVQECIVITTYIPNDELWTDNFRKRRQI